MGTVPRLRIAFSSTSSIYRARRIKYLDFDHFPCSFPVSNELLLQVICLRISLSIPSSVKIRFSNKF